MIAIILAILAPPTRPLLDCILGVSIGFEKEGVAFVRCATNRGKVVIDSDQCSINKDGSWCVSVDDGPMNVTAYILLIHARDCLTREYHVKVPQKGRPELLIDRKDFIFGDLDENNIVDDRDLKAIVEAVGIKQQDVRWDQLDVSSENFHYAKYYDFNRDGVVDEADVKLVRQNLGKRGA